MLFLQHLWTEVLKAVNFLLFYKLAYSFNASLLGHVAQMLSEETLLQEKNFTGSRWDLNPGSC